MAIQGFERNVPAAPELRARLCFWGIVASLWIFHALIAWLTPPQGDDWNALAWVEGHGLVGSSLLSFARRNHILGDVVGLLLAAFRPLHVLLSPTVIVAFFLGIVTHARGRLPRPAVLGDALALALASSLIWIGAPRAGVTLFYRPYLSLFVYGLTALLWFVAAYRLAGARPRAGAARATGMALLGLCAGASNHHLVLVALVWLVVWLRRRRRDGLAIPAWMWTGLGGFVVGVSLLLTDVPYPQFITFGQQAFEGNAIRLFRFLAESGRVVWFCICVAFVLLAHSRFTGRTMPAVKETELPQLGWIFGLALLVAVIGLLGPRWGEPSMLAPTAILAVGAVMVLSALAEDRRARRFLVAFAVAVHLLLPGPAIPTYLRADRELRARLVHLDVAPSDGVALVVPYTEVEQSFWFFGEDLAWSRTRAVVAESFGLSSIEFSEPFGLLEDTPAYEFEIVWSPVRTSGVAATEGRRESLRTPDLYVARRNFAEAAGAAYMRRELEEATLLLTNLDFPERRGRPVIAARRRGKRVLMPISRALGPDKRLRHRFLVSEPSLLGRYPEVYIVGSDGEVPSEIEIRTGRVEYRPTVAARYALVRCNVVECLVVEAAWNAM